MYHNTNNSSLIVYESRTKQMTKRCTMDEGKKNGLYDVEAQHTGSFFYSTFTHAHMYTP